MLDKNEMNSWFYQQEAGDKAYVLDWINETLENFVGKSTYDIAEQEAGEQGESTENVGEILNAYWDDESDENKEAAYRHFMEEENEGMDEMPEPMEMNESVKKIFSLMERMDKYNQNGNSSILL